MISLIKHDALSINLVFDKQGCFDLLNAFKNMYKGERKLPVEIDRFNFNRKDKGRAEIVFEMNHAVEGSDIVFENNGLRWLFDSEYTETGIERFTSACDYGYFYPAEFLRVRLTCNIRLYYVFCYFT